MSTGVFVEASILVIKMDTSSLSPQEVEDYRLDQIKKLSDQGCIIPVLIISQGMDVSTHYVKIKKELE